MSFVFRKKLFGSLAFRVLFTSFIFIIIPLIFYSLVIYNRDYEEKLSDVFEEMHIFQKDQINFILQIEEGALNFLDAFHQLASHIQDKSILDVTLKEFVHRSNLSALFHLSVTPNSELVCTSSTFKNYENVNFTPYFDLDTVKTLQDNIFVGRDPIFGYSLFITFPVVNKKEEVTGIIGASISLNTLIKNLMELRSIHKANLSILMKNGEILASSDPSRIGKKFDAKPISSVNNGFEFYLDHEKRFLTLSQIPYTDTGLALTIPSNAVLTKIYKTLWHLADLLAFILIVGGVLSYLLTLRFAKPLAVLSNVMGKVGAGHLEERFEKDIMGFEINYLGEQFNQMVISLTNYIEEVKRERAFKESYLKELQIGHEIQQSILPEGNIEFSGIRAAVFFQPAKEVAGDFYDWTIKEETLLLTIADGVGKGISACLYSFDLRSVIRAFATMSDDLTVIAEQTNKIFCQDTKETGNFVTAFLALYHKSTRELSFINCGHNYPIVKRGSGKIERLKVDGLAFGVEAFDSVPIKKTTLEPGDFVIFYTDGLTDAQDSARKLFGENRLIEVIEKCSLTSTPEEIIQSIIQEINHFTDGEEQFDDMTLLVFKAT